MRDYAQELSQYELWIYGIGRLQKDFRYVFNDLQVLGYIVNDDVPYTQWQGLPVVKESEYIASSNERCCVVFCDKINGENKFFQRLSSHHLNFLCAEELFCLLDTKAQIIWHKTSKKIAVWGIGKNASTFLEYAQDYYKISFFIDNSNVEDNFNGYPVRHPEKIQQFEWKDLLIIVTPGAYLEIKKQLENYRMRENKDFFHYILMIPPSELMKIVWNEKSRYKLVCHSMLNNLDVSDTSVANCCMTFLKLHFGNFSLQNINDFWNSKLHRIMAVSCLNRTYIFCRENLCPVLINKRKQIENDVCCNDDFYPEISKHPVISNIAIDSSCNLYCESCRNEIQIASGEKNAVMNLLAEKLLSQVTPYAKFITMAGNGEIFLSKIYEKIFTSDKSKNCRYFQVLSNGTLFTSEKWEKLINGRNSDILFCVSIDAATKETYQKLRRGGNFERLLKALALISELRKENKIMNFRMNFVVQRQNYREIPKFIYMAKKFNADRVLFTRILNWGTYNKSEYEERSMVYADGTIKPELKEILDLPICQDPIVDIGTFQGSHNYDDTSYLMNYYLWEIENYSNLDLQRIIFK